MKKRKINYFEISMRNGRNVKENLELAMNLIDSNNKTKSNQRRKRSSLGLPMQFSDCEFKLDKYYFCCIKLIKNEFPETIDKTDDKIEIIDAEFDENKGLYDETHFVIDLNVNNSLKSIIALESTFKGIKPKDIEKFLNEILRNLEIEDEFSLKPIFAFNYENFLDRIDDVAQIKMMFHRDNIAKYKPYDQSTGELLDNALTYTDTEYVTLEFKINFQKRKDRHPSKGLSNRVKNFINIFKTTPEAREHISKLDIKAQDTKLNGRLRLFDLIEEKVASEISVERKRPTSKYYNSSSVYNAIKEQIGRDFRA